MPQARTGRLAPTPSGDLHLGNALAFGAAWLHARSQGHTLVFRNEDIDVGRARPEVSGRQRADLAWLGIDWDQDTPAQSERNYLSALDGLDTYWCACTRKSIAASGGTHQRCDGLPAQHPTPQQATERCQSLRFRLPPGTVTIHDGWWGDITVNPVTEFGDPVLLRRDGLFTYPLAVVVDDWRDGVTDVVRGADLLRPSAIQLRLYQALGLQPPQFFHTPIIQQADGRKLSKSMGSTGIGSLRDQDVSADQVWSQLLLMLGLKSRCLASALQELNQGASLLPTERSYVLK